MKPPDSPSSTPHPVLAAALAAEADLHTASDLEALYMTPADQALALRRLTALISEAFELRGRVLAAAHHSGELAHASGATDMAGWLAHEIHCDSAQARNLVRGAETLEHRRHIATALRDGAILVEQAEVICSALAALPSDLDDVISEKAELHLIELAAEFNPRQLRILGRQILDIVAPEVNEAHEAVLLLREERTAEAKCRFSMFTNGDGTTRFHGVLPDLAAVRLANYLHAFTSPRHRSGEHPLRADSRPSEGDVIDPTDTEVWRKLPYPHRLGQAFCELLESIDPKSLPAHGTASTHLIVTMPLEALRSKLGAANVLGPHGTDRISAAEARRLACTAEIIPAVLGGTGELLDLGKKQRLASKAQKRALMLTHATCQAVDCDRPAAWTEVHHLTPWSQGGKTDLADLALLCSRDHHRIHDPSMTHTVMSDGSIRFHRRT